MGAKGGASLAISFLLTVKYVNVGAGRLGVARHAGVVSGMMRRRAGYRQRARLLGELGGDVDPPIDVVVYHTIVVIPEDVRRRLRTLEDAAL